jgi:hypothetical protein
VAGVEIPGASRSYREESGDSSMASLPRQFPLFRSHKHTYILHSPAGRIAFLNLVVVNDLCMVIDTYLSKLYRNNIGMPRELAEMSRYNMNL